MGRRSAAVDALGWVWIGENEEGRTFTADTAHPGLLRLLLREG